MAKYKSPELRFDFISHFWRDKEDGWICNTVLRKLFEIPAFCSIRLFSSKNSRRDTYLISIDENQSSYVIVGNDKSYFCTYDLYQWLTYQIKNGRPNIGVEIL